MYKIKEENNEPERVRRSNMAMKYEENVEVIVAMEIKRENKKIWNRIIQKKPAFMEYIYKEKEETEKRVR